MKAPTKVVIECTADGWSVSVYCGDRLLVDNRFELLSRGRGVEAPNNADLEEALADYPKLFDEIEGATTFGPFGIAGELYGLRHDS